MKKIVYVCFCMILLLTTGGCKQQIVGVAVSPQCGEQPKVQNMEIPVAVCNKEGDCQPGTIVIPPQCTTRGWAYKPSIGSNVGMIQNNDILPGGLRTFTIPVNSQLFLNPVFFWEEEKQEFYSDFIAVEVQDHQWNITESGLVISPEGESIIPAGSEVKIINVEGIEHLPQLTRSWVNNLYNLIEAVAIVP